MLLQGLSIVFQSLAIRFAGVDDGVGCTFCCSPRLSACLLAGFPVAFSLGGTALLFALFGVIGGGFEPAFLTGLPSRVFGIMTNETLIAVRIVRLYGGNARARA